MTATNLNDARAEILASLPGNPVLYDLGCGKVPFEGFRGIDAHSNHPGIDTIDLYSYPWPIPDNSVDYYRASHFVEHVPDWDAHFSEVWRTLKPGGHYEILAPFYRSDRWFGDPDHKQPILYRRFIYLDASWRKSQQIDHYGARVNFSVANYFEALHDDFLNNGQSEDAIQYAREHFWNVIDDVALILRKEPMPDELATTPIPATSEPTQLNSHPPDDETPVGYPV